MVESNPIELLHPLAALVAGFVTSLHCMGMCGPLACAVLSTNGEEKNSKLVTFGGYHLGKLLSYMILGTLAGAIGSRFVSGTTALPAQVLTWSMVVFFLLLALGLDRVALRLPVVGKLSRTFMKRAYQVRGSIRGLALGLATPFIPCGPLYLMFWVAALAGSASDGAIMMLMFSLGTMPGLLAAQLGWSFATMRLGPDRLARWRRNLAILACCLLAMRSFADTSFAAILTGGACH